MSPPESAATPPRTPGDLRATVRAVLAGRFRDHLYADIRALGGTDDDARRVSVGYVCLFGSIAWLASAGFFWIAYREFGVASQLCLWSAGVGLAACLFARASRDTRPVVVIGILVLIAVAAALLIEPYGAAVALMVVSPMIACLGLLFRTGPMRAVGVITCAACILVLGPGIASVQETATPENTLLLSQIATVSILQAVSMLSTFAMINSMARGFAFAELQQAHNRLVETTERSQLALEAARVGLWEVGAGPDRAIQFTPSLTSILGYSDSEIRQLVGSFRSILHPDDLPAFAQAAKEGLETRSRMRVDLRLKTKTRGYRWFALRARWADEHPTRSGTSSEPGPELSGSLQDIHFMKAAEEALRLGRDRAREADQAKSDFIAVMSHEVRTPLNAILGSVAVLKRGRHDAETVELLDLAQDAGQGLLSVVNDLLDVSRIEAGKMEFDPTPTDIAALVARAVESWRPQAVSRGLTLRLDVEDRMLPPVRVDAPRVRQILANLVSNAIKYTPSGDVKVSMSVSAAYGGAVQLAIRVADSGPGIPPSLAPNLFQPFERGRGAGASGSGLGLYISRNLARLMGGDIVLESTSASGSCFRLILPAPIASAQRIAAPTPAPSADPQWTGARILCVDDNEANRRIASLILAQFGASATLSPSGEDALERCAREPFDVILMDILMPGLDGFQSLERVRAGSGPNQRTPVIALTARLSAEDIARYHASGFDGVVGKPLDIAELVRTLSPHLKDSAHRAA